jgi:phospholipid/cholesterol/gamma-HCH transport system permease protein
MLEMADFVEDRTGDKPVLRFSGRLTLARVGDIPKRLAKLDMPPGAVDLSKIERIDTVGAWLVYKLSRDHGTRVEGASAEAERLIEQVGKAGRGGILHPPPLNPFLRVLSEIGESVQELGQISIGLLSFMGSILIALWDVIRQPSRLRIHAIVQRFELVGVRALAIIGLMNFLVGIVIAQQGAAQLADFGAEGMTVNLVGRLTLRELGVLMAAIMVAGRSGSAFAAQIGTMKLTEEVDAMRTIGVSPIEALVLPRLIASILMMPLLGFYAALAGILGGGLFCWVSLHIAPTAFIQTLREIVPITDVYVGLVKAPVFGFIIAMTGCFQGLQVKSNAEEVGQRTTAAVVQAIFMVIVLDAVFAVLFSQIGWD